MPAKALLGCLIAVGCAAITLSPVAGLDYTVTPGDALSSIAAEHGVTVDDLAEVNRLENPDLIVVGTTLTIPGRHPSTRHDAAAPATHTVASGDSLWAISDRYGVPLGALARLNGVGGDAIIRPGQVLSLPRRATSEASTGSTSGARPDAATHLPTVSRDSGLLGAGRTLTTASGDTPRPAVHTVTAGDSFWAIAQRWDVDLDELLKVNALTRNDVLRVGEVLVLPAPSLAGIDTTKLPADLAASPERLALMATFDHWAEQYAVPADLLKALAWFESGWNNDKRSTANAIGIGQVLPITADFVSDNLIGQTLDPEIPEENIRLSARYLRYLLDHAGSTRLAVASYYQGLTATRQHGVYPSSEFYVQGILALRDRFR